MTKQETKHIEDILSIIVGQPMRSFARAGSMVIADFGELVEIDTGKRDENGRPIQDDNGRRITQANLRGRYGLDISCSMRFTCGDEIIFAQSDIFLPNDEIANRPHFNWDAFEWHVYGNNYFDRKIARHFNGEFSDYIVKSVKVNKFGDLTIAFENDFVLELFVDGSGYSENWRFGEINSTKPLIAVNGNGIDN